VFAFDEIARTIDARGVCEFDCTVHPGMSVKIDVHWQRQVLPRAPRLRSS
jgi:hypothetical protein